MASATADRDVISDMALTARRIEESHSATLKTHLNSLKQSREANARCQEMLCDLVVAVAVSRSSHDKMHGAFVKRGRIISIGIDRIQDFEKQLTGLQDCYTTSTSKSSGSREKFHGKEKELDELSIANDANILTLRDIQSVQRSVKTTNDCSLAVLIDRLSFRISRNSHKGCPKRARFSGARKAGEVLMSAFAFSLRAMKRYVLYEDLEMHSPSGTANWRTAQRCPITGTDGCA